MTITKEVLQATLKKACEKSGAEYFTEEQIYTDSYFVLADGEMIITNDLTQSGKVVDAEPICSARSSGGQMLFVKNPVESEKPVMILTNSKGMAAAPCNFGNATFEQIVDRFTLMLK